METRVNTLQGKDYTYVHFSASTFLAPHLHQFSAVVQKMHLFGADFAL